MGFFSKFCLLLSLILMVVSASELSSAVEARPLFLHQNQNYSNIFETLGVVCKCCDGIGGECTSSWTKSCSNLQCLPWKQH